jgi:hypothetical protein
MKKLRLLSLVGITSIILAQAEWVAAQSGGPGGSGSGGLGGGSLGGFQSSTENQIRTTQAQLALPSKQDRNLRVGKPTTVSKTTGKRRQQAERKGARKFLLRLALDKTTLS